MVLKRFYKLLFLNFLLFDFFIYPMSSDQEFIKKNSLSAEYSQLLDRFFKQNNFESFYDLGYEGACDKFIKLGFYKLRSGSSLVVYNPQLMKFVLKGIQSNFLQKESIEFYRNKNIKLNISRIIVSHRIQSIIDQKFLKHVRVPKKYLYHIPGTGLELNDFNYLVLSEYVQRKEGALLSNMSVELFRETLIVIKEADFPDSNDNNIIIDIDGNVVFLDTEDLNIILGFTRISNLKLACLVETLICENKEEDGINLTKKISTLLNGILILKLYANTDEKLKIWNEFVEECLNEIYSLASSLSNYINYDYKLGLELQSLEEMLKFKLEAVDEEIGYRKMNGTFY